MTGMYTRICVCTQVLVESQASIIKLRLTTVQRKRGCEVVVMNQMVSWSKTVALSRLGNKQGKFYIAIVTMVFFLIVTIGKDHPRLAKFQQESLAHSRKTNWV